MDQVMMVAGLLLLLGGLTQTDMAGTPPREEEIRADAALRRAWEGRQAAVDRICGDRTRIVRIGAVDERFGRLQQAYQKQFGTAWSGEDVVNEGQLDKLAQPSANGVLSNAGKVDPRCQSINAFAGALGEYQNGVTMAEASLSKH
jgi:hypothetical protein